MQSLVPERDMSLGCVDRDGKPGDGGGRAGGAGGREEEARGGVPVGAEGL